MAHSFIDLGFDLDAGPLGKAAGQPSTDLYPLQFALVRDGRSWCPIGNADHDNGGFAGGDRFEIRLFDLTSLRPSVTAAAVDIELAVYSSSVEGKPCDPFERKPPFVPTSRGASWGWLFPSLERGVGRSEAFGGEELPMWTLEDGVWEFRRGIEEGYFELSFGCPVARDDSTVAAAVGLSSAVKQYVTDPELFVGTTEFDM